MCRVLFAACFAAYRFCDISIRVSSPSGSPTHTKAKAPTVTGDNHPWSVNTSPSPIVAANTGPGRSSDAIRLRPMLCFCIHTRETLENLFWASSKRPKTSAVMPKFLTSLMPSTNSTVRSESCRSASV